LCKQHNIEGLIEKHSDIVTTILTEMCQEGHTIENIMNEYNKYPDFHILTTMFDPQKWDIIKNLIMDSKYGFSMDTLFSLTNGKNKQFQYPYEVSCVLQFISGYKKESNFKNKDLSMFTRINTIVREKSSRPPFTQLWFLPANGINDISKNLKKLIMEDDILTRYDVFIVNSKSDDDINDIHKEIQKRENVAKENKKLGLIILAGHMLTLGITLPLCDIVFLMNDTLSSDKVMQMMYRSMTESKNKDKKCGFVVDMKISRVLQACISYNIHKKIHNAEEKIRFLIENHLINIDSDYLIGRKIDSNTIISKLLEIWKSDPINNINTLLRQIEDDIVEMENDDQKALNKYFTKSINGDKFDVKIELKNDDMQNIKSGKEIIKSICDTDTDTDTDSCTDTDTDADTNVNNKIESKISLTKDVLPFTIPFACLLTLKDTNNDFIEMLNTISNDIELLEIFNEQSFIWWNNKDIIELIKKLTSKYIEKNSNTFNIAIIIKMSLKSLIDKPRELLEFISDRLKPKQKEKKEFGEVFTPMELVGEMLDKLDECYKKENQNNSIFSNKNIKWYDPASGMGNFPIEIYLRLMDGLKNVIENKSIRKKHILENMLYMSELNKKNAIICKQIFDINNEYATNINQGDSLVFDAEQKWGIKKFDVVIGNPPYQDGSGNKGNKLWTKFVDKILKNKPSEPCILKDNGFLVFVHPSLWRQINHDIQKTMTCKQIMYLEIHNEKDGIKTFSANTRYDWYVLYNVNCTTDTIIKDEDGQLTKANIYKMNFIPNSKFDTIVKLTSSNEKVEILHSESFYEPRKEWMSEKKDDEYKYLCIYSINRKNVPSFKYSRINNKGHFGIPKVIWGGGATGFIIDENGDYGMTQWASAITDNVENLKQIKNAMESKDFQELIKAISVSKQEINYKILREFNKKFYEEFIKKEVKDDIKKIVEKPVIKKPVIEKPVIKKPVIKKPVIESNTDSSSDDEKPKKVIKKPVIKKPVIESNTDSSSDDEKPKKVIKKPVIKKPVIESSSDSSSEDEKPKKVIKKPAIKKQIIKPNIDTDTNC